jgi:exodeoxyribonuclease VII small subunit
MEEPDYETAMKQLESIVSKMESGELNVDAMTAELKQAQKLIKLCRDKLTKTDEEIKKILAAEEEDKL